MSAGRVHSCGVTVDGRGLCWGDNSEGETDLSGGFFKSLGAGYYTSCGIRTSSRIECFGYDAYNIFSDEPDGKFRQVDYGSYSEHACAVEKNGESIQCWGTNNTYGQQDVPPGLD